jgi:hypothetical protein
MTRSALLLVSFVLVGQVHDLSGQVAAPKLATVLADLASSLPQDAGDQPAVNQLQTLVFERLPASVRDAHDARRLRLDARNGVQVYILLTDVGEARLQQLAALGVRVEIVSAAERRVQARVPVTRLARVAALPFVEFIRPPTYAVRHAGRFSSEGDGIHGADVARAEFGVDGTGVAVGVISDGIKGLVASGCRTCAGAPAGPIATRDLPDASGSRNGDGVLTSVTGGVTARSFRSDADLEGPPPPRPPCSFEGAGAEGTALLEIVHDVAPGAALSFANIDTGLEFNAAVNALARDNDVVVDDLGFYGYSSDGGSPISRNTAAALNDPANRIRTYVTSAGNAADEHYFGRFTDSRVDGRPIRGISNAGRLHLFERTPETTDVLGRGSQPYNVLALPSNGEVFVILTWNDPAGRSGNNYDLFLVREDGGHVVARSTDTQRGGQDPLEIIDFTNRGDAGLFRIVIQNVGSRAEPRDLNLFAFAPQCAPARPRRLAAGRHERLNYTTASRSLPAQSDAGGSPVSVISVGAVCSASAAAADVFAGSDAPSESCNDRRNGTIQFFSSRGPTLDGRVKPDVAGIDGVSITGAGAFPSPFFGTSAAAPHVAAIAALVLHAAPCLKSGGPGAFDAATARARTRDLILTSADPLGPVPNNTFGYGLANAFRSVERARAACAR